MRLWAILPPMQEENPAVPQAQIRVVREAEREVEIRSGAMTRVAGVSESLTGATGIHLGESVIPPGRCSSPHYHSNCETAIVVISGRGVMLTGDDLSVEEEIGPGDMIYIPQGAAHQPFEHQRLRGFAPDSGTQQTDRASCGTGWCRPQGLLIAWPTSAYGRQNRRRVLAGLSTSGNARHIGGDAACGSWFQVLPVQHSRWCKDRRQVTPSAHHPHTPFPDPGTMEPSCGLASDAVARPDVHGAAHPADRKPPSADVPCPHC